MNLNFAVAPSVISDTIGSDTIVINVKTGAYYSLTQLGSSVWNAINTNSLDSSQLALVKVLIDENLVSCNVDNLDIVEDLVDTSIIFEKYPDMESLLMADPIHEVDDLGWPKLKQ